MAFQHSCFISYVHSGIAEDSLSIMRRVVDQMEQLLAAELDTQVDQDVYRDTNQLRAGKVIDPALGLALCQSAAWMMIYTPRYPKHEYCRREYAAMCALAQQRRQMLGRALGADEGMIFPVVLRGDLEHLPEQVARYRYVDLRAFNAASNPIYENPTYAEEVHAIAEHVRKLCEIGETLDETASDCGGFALPPAPPLAEWMVREQEFPGR